MSVLWRENGGRAYGEQIEEEREQRSREEKRRDDFNATSLTTFFIVLPSLLPSLLSSLFSLLFSLLLSLLFSLLLSLLFSLLLLSLLLSLSLLALMLLTNPPHAGAVVNSFTHVLIYLHYALTTFGWDTTTWKRWLTSLQMVQFFVCGIHALYCLLVAKNYPPWLCCLNLFVQGNMTILFRDFYKKSYHPKTKSATTTEPTIEPTTEPTTTLSSPNGSSSVIGKATAKLTSAERNSAVQTYTMAEVSARNGGNGVSWCVVNNDVLDL